jgi:heme-degrading monooxygenase HmoA
VIARIWRGRTPAVRADEYVAYLEGTGLAEYRATDGNRGVLVLRREVDGIAEFTILTLWDSMDAIRRFAGDDPEQARYYPRDPEFLLEMPPLVEHHEIPWHDLPGDAP